MYKKMEAFSKLCLSCVFCLAVVLLVLENVGATAPEFDPYRVLGVSPHASQDEIKKAYKQLAKEWHPDKNKDQGADDMFIKISKSYKILSNEEHRTTYDQFGQIDENQQSFGFTQSSQYFPNIRHLLNYEQYVNNVVPDSFNRPYLIKVSSEWCFTCMYVEPIWKETVKALEPLGVGIGVIETESEKNLANHLGAHSIPYFLGLVNGRVTYFHKIADQESLRQLVESLLPQKLVKKVTDDNYVQFLNGWREENMPSMLLFDSVSSAPLLYKLTAFAHRDFVRFGYGAQAETKRFLQQFNITTNAPTLLLFKEKTDKPADFTQSTNMKKKLLNEFVSKNRFLLVPRLVNQRFFDELCPVKQSHQSHKYCVLLITGEDESFVSANTAYYDFASSNTKEVLRFAYVFQEQQQPLCNALLKNPDVNTPQVVILERSSSTGKAIYCTVTGGWNGSDEDKRHLHEQLLLLQRDPSILTSDAMLPELHNVLDSMFLVRWLNAAYDYLSKVYFNLLYSNWREMMPILSLIFAVFIVFCTVIIQTFSDSGEKNITKQKDKESPKTSKRSHNEANLSRWNRMAVFSSRIFWKLTDVTYANNLVKPGHMNVLLVLTDESKQVLLKMFEEKSLLSQGLLQFSFFNTDKHSQWLDSLL